MLFSYTLPAQIPARHNVNPLIVFTHIPKTAGSSFRHEAERCFGPEKMLFDYGPAAKLSSPLVREWVFEREDLEGFTNAVHEGGFRFLSGHFPLKKYAAVFPKAAFVCWVREPVARVWSNYRHLYRHDRFDQDLESFYKAPKHCNVQSRMIGKDPDRMAFIGITERYAESLERFNQQFSLDFGERRANRAPDADVPEPEPTEEVKQRIRSFNAEDVALYDNVRQRFPARE